ncbi:hypothetical protein NitYY0826_C1552 [Nitratiruptor sp. YY08-26]|uniref:Hpt domain-containing protein n=1 Tax=unclassified Nitratiruptor TaxID=2624044 RepID=UPI001915DB32|nr:MULTISPECIES: Hpt domain-containing protein [unclassified Nitratiruptor]BCD62669.1 hypothetical protein NitYY0813_C1550 [Nitratiruptor sp. YY08-13]BCD66605.1 hypothetical protein NitYY0826_C1552 [Nitratiruptor sp. YY08-26]
MILYDAQKRIIAINEQTLEMLGYSSLEEFKKEVTDLSQFFVKKPGYIHQFRSFHWIDYVLTNTTVTHRALLQTKDGKVLEVFLKVTQLGSLHNLSNYYLVTFEFNTFNEECIIANIQPQQAQAKPTQPATSTPAMQPEPEYINIEEKEMPSLDLESISIELNLDQEIILDFIKEYISHAVEKLDEINSFIKKRDTKSLYSTIHTLKGVAANLRLKPIQEVLSQVKKESSVEEMVEKLQDFYAYIKYLAKEFNVTIDKELKLFNPNALTPSATTHTQEQREEPSSSNEQPSSVKGEVIEEAATELGLSLNEYQEYLKELINEIKLNLAYNNYNELHKLASFARNLYLQECAKYLDQVNVNQNPELVKKCIQDLESLKKEPSPFTISLEELQDSLELTQIDKDDFIEILEDLIIELKTLNSIKMRKEKFLKKAKQLKSVAESLRLSNLVLLLNNIISNYPLNDILSKQLEDAISSLEENIRKL